MNASDVFRSPALFDVYTLASAIAISWKTVVSVRASTTNLMEDIGSVLSNNADDDLPARAARLSRAAQALDHVPFIQW
jgi:hypothetical protein